MRVYINGESREVQGNPSLADLINQLDLSPTRIAVEHNREVVRRSDWANRQVHDDDRIEIVHFVGGGAQEQEQETGAGTQTPAPANCPCP